MISVLVPCYNEERFIAECLGSITAFIIPAGQAIEILVIDGGSSDRTRDIVAETAKADVRIRLIDNPERIQSCALNRGIHSSRGEWIMRLDAHAQYPPDYLALCYETALATGADNVGGICLTRPGSASYAAQLVQALTTHRFGVGNSGFRTGSKAGFRDTVPFGFFRREIFERIGYFDERLVRTQDYEFNCRIRQAGGKIYLNPAIVSTYFNLPTLTAFLEKQLFRQGPYNAYMWYLAPYAFVPRHAATAFFTLFFWTGLAGSLLSTAHLPCWGAVMATYAFLALLAAAQQAAHYGFWRHLLCLPFGFFLFHLCHGTGVLSGLSRLAVHTAPVQKIREPWPGAKSCRTWPLAPGSQCRQGSGRLGPEPPVCQLGSDRADDAESS
jgi:glycosyltransferase involved in cell wall biosynthesis